MAWAVKMLTAPEGTQLSQSPHTHLLIPTHLRDPPVNRRREFRERLHVRHEMGSYRSPVVFTPKKASRVAILAVRVTKTSGGTSAYRLTPTCLQKEQGAAPVNIRSAEMASRPLHLGLPTTTWQIGVSAPKKGTLRTEWVSITCRNSNLSWLPKGGEAPSATSTHRRSAPLGNKPCLELTRANLPALNPRQYTLKPALRFPVNLKDIT